MGNRLGVDHEKTKNIRKHAEASNPAHLFLQCLASRCTLGDDSEEVELAEQDSVVVKGAATYVRPSDSPSA